MNEHVLPEGAGQLVQPVKDEPVAGVAVSETVPAKEPLQVPALPTEQEMPVGAEFTLPAAAPVPLTETLTLCGASEPPAHGVTMSPTFRRPPVTEMPESEAVAVVVARMSSRIAEAEVVPSDAQSATAPVTWGVAIEVPL